MSYQFGPTGLWEFVQEQQQSTNPAATSQHPHIHDSDATPPAYEGAERSTRSPPPEKQSDNANDNDNHSSSDDDDDNLDQFWYYGPWAYPHPGFMSHDRKGKGRRSDMNHERRGRGHPYHGHPRPPHPSFSPFGPRGGHGGPREGGMHPFPFFGPHHPFAHPGFHARPDGPPRPPAGPEHESDPSQDFPPAPPHDSDHEAHPSPPPHHRRHGRGGAFGGPGGRGRGGSHGRGRGGGDFGGRGRGDMPEHARGHGRRSQCRLERPPISIRLTPEAYRIDASIPGVQKENILVSFEDNTNTVNISGQFPERAQAGSEEMLVQEHDTGAFTRKISLEHAVSADFMTANLEAGILVIEIPRADSGRTMTIPVHEKGKERESAFVEIDKE